MEDNLYLEQTILVQWQGHGTLHGDRVIILLLFSIEQGLCFFFLVGVDLH